jgi:hypothetical protein
MSIPEKYLACFEEQNIYHIYNITNNQELLFKCEENYHYFLKQYRKYLFPFVQTFSYNLLPNHFHLVIRVRSLKEIQLYLQALPVQSLIKAEKDFLEKQELSFTGLIEAEFHRLFTSYSMSFNKMYSRKGNLFHRPFKRVCVKDDIHFCQLMVYLHSNAMKHRLVKKFQEYKWSSYNSFISSANTLLERDYVFGIFGSKGQFVEFHETQSAYYYGVRNSMGNE